MRTPAGEVNFLQPFPEARKRKKSVSQAMLGCGNESKTLSKAKGAGVPVILHVGELV